MYYLTKNKPSFFRKNQSKVLLAFWIVLSLSGGGGLASAEGKLYNYVNPWGTREATEGDPIEVKWMSGGDGKLKAGTDDTSEVTVHSLMTWGNPEVYVKGKKITVGDNYPSSDPKETQKIPTANWGGKIFIGDDTTESVTMKGIQAGNKSETTIHGDTISVGKLGTGDGKFTVGNENTSSVTINDFGAGEGSDSKINGHSISMGSLSNHKGTVTINADGAFQVEKDEKLQDIEVNSGGALSITAGSVRAGKLYATNPNSSITVYANTEKGVSLSRGIGATDKASILIDSPSVMIDGEYNFYDTNNSKITLQGKDLYIKGNVNVTNSSLNAAETGTIRLGQEGGHARFTFTGSNVSLGNENTQTYLYGTMVTSKTVDSYNYSNITPCKVDINGKYILIDGVSKYKVDGRLKYSTDYISPDGDIITVGDTHSDVVLNGRLFNSNSQVTVNGQSIHLSSAYAAHPDLVDSKDSWVYSASQRAIQETGDSKMVIGNKNTDRVMIDGVTWVDNGSLSMQGKNIHLSYARGIALDGSEKANISVGENETDNVRIDGQIINRGANRIQISGQHITIDSTKYGGPEIAHVPFSESIIAFENNVYAGNEDTKSIFISNGLNARHGDIKVKGRYITIGGSNYFNTPEIRKKYNLYDGFIANATNGDINIGGDDSDVVHLSGGQLLAGAKDINVKGKNIAIDANDALIRSEFVTKGAERYERVSMIRTLNGNVDIGSENSDTIALQGGTLLADGSDYYTGIPFHINVLGKNISIDGKKQWAGETNGGSLSFGSETSDLVSIQGKGGIYTRGGAASIKGKQIFIHSDKENALENDGAPIMVGSPDTQSIHVSGGIVSHGSQISLTGHNISISKGEQNDTVYTNGGTVLITADSNQDAHISGPIKNDRGQIKISLSGRDAHLDSQIITKNPIPKNFMYGGGATEIALSNKASWSPKGEVIDAISDKDGEKSNFTTYIGNDGIFYLDNKTKQTITVSDFLDKGTRIHEDIYGSGNTGNDAIHIDNSYSGNTHFWLVNRDDTDKGVVGTILASAGSKDESSSKSAVILAALNSTNEGKHIPDFTADHFVAYGMSNLFFKTYNLGIQDSKVEKDNTLSDVTKGKLYDQDLVITGVTNHTTNEYGQYTPTVSAALAGSSLMYYTWRTENDKMLQRVGNLRENEGEETGFWARIRGSRIGRDGYRSFKNQYKVYELGYDRKTADNDRLKSFSGIAFSYLDGKGEYSGGQGTNQAVSAALYHTDIRESGHYLDMVFRLRHLNERFHVRDTVDTDIGPITEDNSASMHTTGVSFSAEYGRKKFIGHQWYVEPQTQWTLGYLGHNHYDMDNGTRVEQPGITSFVGRLGFNLGRQISQDAIVYLKANVHHEFGGHSPLHLYAGDESLSFTDTFDDTWFEYGGGFAVKLNGGVSLYGDFEKSAGSRFSKDWQWNAGIRYSF